jgi:ketosteroid isomerase-like protein
MQRSRSTGALFSAVAGTMRTRIRHLMRTNLDVVKAMTDAAVRQDEDAFVASCASDVVWEESTGGYLGLPAVSRGHAGVRKWFREAIVEPWSELECDDKFEEVDEDCVLIERELRGVGHASGVETCLNSWEIGWFRDGKIRRRHGYREEAEARAAAAREPAYPD